VLVDVIIKLFNRGKLSFLFMRTMKYVMGIYPRLKSPLARLTTEIWSQESDFTERYKVADNLSTSCNITSYQTD